MSVENPQATSIEREFLALHQSAEGGVEATIAECASRLSPHDRADVAQEVWVAVWAGMQPDARHPFPTDPRTAQGAVRKLAAQFAAEALASKALVSRRDRARIKTAEEHLVAEGVSAPTAQQVAAWTRQNCRPTERVSEATVILARGRFVDDPTVLEDRPAEARALPSEGVIDLERGSVLTQALLDGEPVDRTDDDLLAYLLTARMPATDQSKEVLLFKAHEIAKLLQVSMAGLEVRKAEVAARILASREAAVRQDTRYLRLAGAR